MFNTLFAPLLFSWIGAVAGWTYTDYFITMTDIVFLDSGKYTTTVLAKVYATGPVSPTSTKVNTTLVSQAGNRLDVTATYLITVTELFLSIYTSICEPNFDCRPSQTNSMSPTTNIDTSYYAPLVISVPSSCTKTNFHYTTPKPIALRSVGEDGSTNLVGQATESSEALFITTYLLTLSTNLDGQAVTTTRCDVYLKDDAIVGLHSADEAYYLGQCVDPHHFLCTSTSTVAYGSCPVTRGVYPPNGKTGGVSGTDRPATVSPTASSTSKGGVGGLGALASQGLRLLGLPMSILVFTLL